MSVTHLGPASNSCKMASRVGWENAFSNSAADRESGELGTVTLR
jgi:hypothetical protein